MSQLCKGLPPPRPDSYLAPKETKGNRSGWDLSSRKGSRGVDGVQKGWCRLGGGLDQLTMPVVRILQKTEV